MLEFVDGAAHSRMNGAQFKADLFVIFFKKALFYRLLIGNFVFRGDIEK